MTEQLRRPAEPPCVWSTAGVLDYRPCGRDFECEGCPLYQALRGGGAGPDETPLTFPGAAPSDDATERYLAELASGCALPLDRAYGADGLWIEDGPAGELCVGLDDYALRLLYPVDALVLPRVGTWLPRGAPCAWVNRGRLAIPLRCPIAGEVSAVHPHPATRWGGAEAPRGGKAAGPAAEAARRRGAARARAGAGAGAGAPRGAEAREPEGVGAGRWWFRLRPHEPVAAAAVYRHEGLLAWYLHRLRAVREQLSAVMARDAGIAAGAALNDGGLPEANLEAVLGRERFEALVGALFPMRG